MTNINPVAFNLFSRATLAALITLAPVTASGADWNQWRGVNGRAIHLTRV